MVVAMVWSVLAIIDLRVVVVADVLRTRATTQHSHQYNNHISTTITSIPPAHQHNNDESSATAEVARVGGHYAVQGHSRSPIR